MLITYIYSVFLVDVNFFKDYVKTMKPVCQALDVLQEEKAYLGILLPTLTTCLAKLNVFVNENEQMICRPLAVALADGRKTRFQESFSYMDFILASAFHPNFKLCWLHLLAPIIGEAEILRSRVLEKMVSVVQETFSKSSCGTQVGLIPETDSTTTTDSETEEDFFSSVFPPKEEKQKNARETVETFLHRKFPVRPASISHLSFDDATVMSTFITYNTAVPSSAAVERLFSPGKDALKPKRGRLSDKHFEMLVFLK